MDSKKITDYAFWLLLLAAWPTALEATKNLNELKKISILGIEISKEFQQTFWLLLLAFILIAILVIFISKLRIFKDIRKIEKVAAGNTVAVTLLLMERCQELVSSGKIDEYAKKHINKITTKIDDTSEKVDNKIYSVINEDFFDRAVKALKNKNTKRGFDPVLNRAYNSLVGKQELDDIVKREYDLLLKELSDYITKWLRDTDISEYLKATDNLQSKFLAIKKDVFAKIYFMFNPRVEDLIALDYEKLIVTTAALIPAFQIYANRIVSTYGNTKVASLGIFMDDFDIIDNLDIGNIDIDVSGYDVGIAEELGDQVASELFEYVGAAIPYIGFAFILIKAIRYYNLIKYFINKPEKIREMRESVRSQILQFLESYKSKHEYEMERSSFKLVAMLKDEFQAVHNMAKLKL